MVYMESGEKRENLVWVEADTMLAEQLASSPFTFSDNFKPFNVQCACSSRGILMTNFERFSLFWNEHKSL